VAAAEQGRRPAPRHTITTATATTAPRPTRAAPTRTVAPPPHTTATPPRTTARTVAAHRQPKTPAPARATDGPTTAGVLCSTQRLCRPATTPTRPASTPAPHPAPPRPNTRTSTAPPANLCVQQGLCR
jgi:hypothetical protein